MPTALTLGGPRSAAVPGGLVTSPARGSFQPPVESEGLRPVRSGSSSRSLRAGRDSPGVAGTKVVLEEELDVKAPGEQAPHGVGGDGRIAPAVGPVGPSGHAPAGGVTAHHPRHFLTTARDGTCFPGVNSLPSGGSIIMVK